MTQVALPSAARERLRERFGPGTGAWLDAFGTQVEALCQQWELIPGAVHAGGTGAVVDCRSPRDGRRYGLKVTPDRTIALQEAAALTYWAETPTVVDLVAEDLDRGALLLAWLPSATTLGSGTWTLRELAQLIGGLYGDGRQHSRAAPPVGLPSATERLAMVFDLWDRRRRALPESPVTDEEWDRCRGAALDMAAAGETLLHGDLHPGNILRSGGNRRVVAIDPRPCLGDPAMDLADLAMSSPDGQEGVRRRCIELAAMTDTVDADRILIWCCHFTPIKSLSLAHARAVGPK